MKSVSGKDWEEVKFNKRITDKIKIDNNKQASHNSKLRYR